MIQRIKELIIEFEAKKRKRNREFCKNGVYINGGIVSGLNMALSIIKGSSIDTAQIGIKSHDNCISRKWLTKEEITKIIKKIEVKHFGNEYQGFAEALDNIHTDIKLAFAPKKDGE